MKPLLAIFTDEDLAKRFCEDLRRPDVLPQAILRPDDLLLIAEYFQKSGVDEIARDIVAPVRQWARQTIAFACSVENAPKSGVPKEVLEQNFITAEQVANRPLGEAIAKAGDDCSITLTELVNRVLDWVVQKRKNASQS